MERLGPESVRALPMSECYIQYHESYVLPGIAEPEPVQGIRWSKNDADRVWGGRSKEKVVREYKSDWNAEGGEWSQWKFHLYLFLILKIINFYVYGCFACM